MAISNNVFDSHACYSGILRGKEKVSLLSQHAEFPTYYSCLPVGVTSLRVGAEERKSTSGFWIWFNGREATEGNLLAHWPPNRPEIFGLRTRWNNVFYAVTIHTRHHLRCIWLVSVRSSLRCIDRRANRADLFINTKTWRAFKSQIRN